MRLTDEQRMEVEYHRGKADALKEVGELLKPQSEVFMGRWLEPLVEALLEGRMPE